MKLSSSNVKKKIIFLKESLLYVSGNRNPPKIPYISGNGAFLYFRKLLIFQEVTFQALKIKVTHY